MMIKGSKWDRFMENIFGEEKVRKLVAFSSTTQAFVVGVILAVITSSFWVGVLFFLGSYILLLGIAIAVFYIVHVWNGGMY